MMVLTSRDFKDSHPIPTRYTGEGEEISPALEWSGASPELKRGVVEYALICEDPDAPKIAGREHPFIHWIAYGIPPELSSLPEGIEQVPDMLTPVRCSQGVNSLGKVGYNGPMPPEGYGIHRYYFTLFALGFESNLPPLATKEMFLKAIDGSVLATAQLMGTYRAERWSPPFGKAA